MKPEMKLKMSIDFVMTVLLVFLMSYQITGQKFHEWLGTAMVVLFIVHNLLNIRWYKNLIKGKYKPLRIMQTVVNISVFIAMVCLAFSGIVMSRYVFAAVNGPVATARSMHLAASYWGFVLMSIHLGMHWAQICTMIRNAAGKVKSKGVENKNTENTNAVNKSIEDKSISTWILRGIAVITAGYGLYCFVQKNIVSYMFLINQFVFFDYEQSAAVVLMQHIAMMGFWIFITYYAVKLLIKMTSKSKTIRR